MVSNIQYIFPLCTDELGEYITWTYNQEQSLRFWGNEKKSWPNRLGINLQLFRVVYYLITLSIVKINTAMVTDEWSEYETLVERWWRNQHLGEKPVLELLCPQKKSHMDWSNITTGSLKWKARKQPPELWWPSTVKQKSYTLIRYYLQVRITGQVIIQLILCR